VILLLAHVGFTAWSSSRSGEAVSRFLPGPTGNWMHVVSNAVLAAIAVAALARRDAAGRFRRPRPGDRLWAGILLLVVMRGVADEVHQHFVPGRTCSVLDIASDGLGASLVLLAPPRARMRSARAWLPFLLALALALALGVAGATGRPWPDRVLEDWLHSLF
jgi:hypothetical protein